MSAKSDDKEILILEAALRIFSEKGYAQTRLSDVADEVGVAKGTLYLYFSSKEDLFRAAIIRELHLGEADVEQIANRSELLPHERLAAICENHLNYFAARRTWRIWITDRFEHDQKLSEEMQDFMQRYMQRIERIMEEEQVENVRIATLAFMGILDSFRNELMMQKQIVDMHQHIQERVNFVRSWFHRPNNI